MYIYMCVCVFSVNFLKSFSVNYKMPYSIVLKTGQRVQYNLEDFPSLIIRSKIESKLHKCMYIIY